MVRFVSMAAGVPSQQSCSRHAALTDVPGNRVGQSDNKRDSSKAAQRSGSNNTREGMIQARVARQLL